MTDRHAGYVVILRQSVREDDAEEGVLNAIRMIRGVDSVQPVLDRLSFSQQIAEERVMRKVREALNPILYPWTVRAEQS